MVVVVSLATAMQAYAVKPYRIPSSSMEPTLAVGERIVVDRFSERTGGDPDVGDVVVFNPPLGAVVSEQDPKLPVAECAGASGPEQVGTICPQPGDAPARQAYVKRVVAGPGARLEIVNGRPIVDGEPLEEPWRTLPCESEGLPCNPSGSIVVPPDSYFVMGDNRPGSSDSRFWGPVPRDWIIGEAILSYWPPSRVGGI